MESVAIVGAGGWGTALAVLLRGRSPTLWVRRPELAEILQDQRINEVYLPGVRLPDSIRITHELGEIGAPAFLVWATPSTAVRKVAALMKQQAPLPADTVVISAVKGLEHSPARRMSESLAEIFPSNPIAVLSGPNHAQEVARGVPSATVIGCSDHALAREIQVTFSTENFRVYTSDDLAGIELGGALKNIFALAAGVSDGLGLGDNSKAALVTRALTEMVRLGLVLGGKRETFYGLSGIGDMMVTCFSRHSRNRRAGELLGQGLRIDQIVAELGTVPEGIPTAHSARTVARKLQIETPIVDAVADLLLDRVSAGVAMRQLLRRDLRAENF